MKVFEFYSHMNTCSVIFRLISLVSIPLEDAVVELGRINADLRWHKQ